MSHAESNQLKILAHGIELLLPDGCVHAGKTVFLRAQGASFVRQANGQSWCLEQSFAPHAFALQDAGFSVKAQQLLGEGTATCVLYSATRFAEENRAELARAWEALKVGGWLLAAQTNVNGAKRLQKDMQELAGDVTYLSKFHGRAIAAQKCEGRAVPEGWANACKPTKVPDVPLMAAAGMFSYRKVDAGSRLLLEHLPKELTGHGADICAGWGYLSWGVPEVCPHISSITLFEAEARALEMAKENLRDASIPLQFEWADASRPTTHTHRFDWGVMNPPAHDLADATPGMSAAILLESLAMVRKGGSLWLVANRHLPYERTLIGAGATVRSVCETPAYKILEART